MDAARRVFSTLLVAILLFAASALAGDGQGAAAGQGTIPLPTGLSKDAQFIIYYMDKRFGIMQHAVDRRLEMMQHAMDRRFDLMQHEVDKRFDMFHREMDKRFDMLHREMDKRFQQVDKRFVDFDKRFAEVDKRFEMLIRLMEAIIGAFVAIVAVVIAFALWDRRTMTRPFEDKIEKLEEDSDRLRRLIAALRKLAKQDAKLAEVLRSFSLL